MARKLYVPPFEVDAIPDVCTLSLADAMSRLLDMRARLNEIDATKRPRAMKTIDAYMERINIELLKREVGGGIRG